MYENLSVPNRLRVSKSAKSHCGILFKSDSMTHQEFLQLSRITSILEKYKRTGILPNNGKVPIPLQAQTRPDLSDFQTLYNYVCDLRNEPEKKIVVAEGASVVVDNPSDVAEGVQPSQTKEASPSSGEQPA